MKVDCYASREVEGQYGKRMTKRRRGNREHERRAEKERGRRRKRKRWRRTSCRSHRHKENNYNYVGTKGEADCIVKLTMWFEFVHNTMLLR